MVVRGCLVVDETNTCNAKRFRNFDAKEKRRNWNLGAKGCTVSLVSFHDLLPCFPNDTLILNPFSLYTHRHDKILSGVNDDDEL